MISIRESGIRPPGTLLATSLLMSGKFVNKLVIAYVGFEKSEIFLISSDDGGGATPVPIPNTEVKSSSVEGTWRAAAWESRTLLV